MITKETKEKIVGDFKQHDTDTGSAGVQIALLTNNIKSLTDHCQKNPKDMSSRRGLLKMVCRRRSLLSYVHKHDKNAYKLLIDRLGLRK